jgi:V8-like Glu-specific endopeptidase
LSLDGRWCPCNVRHRDGSLWIFHAADGIEGGMSGSPILGEDDSAIGVLVTGGGVSGAKHTDGGPQPGLTRNLPGWLVSRREAF